MSLQALESLRGKGVLILPFRKPYTVFFAAVMSALGVKFMVKVTLVPRFTPNAD